MTLPEDSEAGFSFRDLVVPFVVVAALAAAVLVGLHIFSGYRGDMQEHFADIHGAMDDSDDNPFVNTRLSQGQVDARDSVTQGLVAAKGDLQWPVLAKADMKIVKSGGSDTASPVYTPAIRALDGKTQTADGYMFPLDKSDMQSHFLLSPYPSSCPYCLPAGPQELIEIKLKTPIAFTYDALKVRGTFHLLTGEDVANGMFYRMTDADISK